MPAGRPSDYTQELADAICEKLVDGLSLRSICKRDEFPNIVTVLRWVKNNEENEIILASLLLLHE